MLKNSLFKNLSPPSRVLILSLLFVSGQLIYKFYYEEPFPSLCYPSFANTSKVIKNRKSEENKYCKFPLNLDLNNVIYANDSIKEVFQQNKWKNARSCKYVFQVILEDETSTTINTKKLFGSLKLSSIMIDRTIHKKFWDFPSNQTSYFRKGAQFPIWDIYQFESFLRVNIKKQLKKGTTKAKTLEVKWMNKKDNSLVKTVTIKL